MKRELYVTVALLCSLCSLTEATAQAKPLKVFILAGQSNMEGHAKIETFDYIGDDPATAPLLQKMRGADGQPRVCEHVSISYFTGSGDEEPRACHRPVGGTTPAMNLLQHQRPVRRAGNCNNKVRSISNLNSSRPSSSAIPSSSMCSGCMATT